MAGEEYGRPTEKDGSGGDAGGLRRLGQEESVARSHNDPGDHRHLRPIKGGPGGKDEVEEQLGVSHASKAGSGAQQADRGHPDMMRYPL
jgi:hypothetical protein